MCGCLDPEDEGTMILWNINNYLTSNTLARPRRLESSMRKHHAQHSQIFTTSAYHHSTGFITGYLLSNLGECLHRSATKIMNIFDVVTRSILLCLCNRLVWNHTQNFSCKLQITAKYCIKCQYWLKDMRISTHMNTLWTVSITQPNQYWHNDITTNSDWNTLQLVLTQRHHNQYWHKHITMSIVIILQSVAIMFKNERRQSKPGKQEMI